MSDIVISSLSKSFGAKTLFKDLDMRIPEGSKICIMGESGCGKTTLLRILIGFENADSGEITGLCGRKLSAVFQENRLCESLGAMQNVLMVLCGNRKKRAESIPEIRRMFLETGFSEEDLAKPVSKLSGGMKRRVSIIRALAAECDVIIMDEPFKELDEETKAKVISLVIEKTAGKTLLMVTHDSRDADALGAEIRII